MCPATPCKLQAPPDLSQMPRYNEKCSKAARGCSAPAESSSSSCSPRGGTPSDPPTAPEVPILRPSVPRSFARECSSSSGPVTHASDTSQESSLQSPLSVNLPSSATSETTLQDTSNHQIGQKIHAVPLHPEYLDGLAALQQYSSSIDESASSTPSQMASALISPNSTTPTSKNFENPITFLLSETSKDKVGRSNGGIQGPDGQQKQIPKPYCPPHKRRPLHLASSQAHEERQFGGADRKLGGTQKVGFRMPLSQDTSAVFPSSGSQCGGLDAMPEERNIRATDKAPFLEKLLASSAVPTSAGGICKRSPCCAWRVHVLHLLKLGREDDMFIALELTEMSDM